MKSQFECNCFLWLKIWPAFVREGVNIWLNVRYFCCTRVWDERWNSENRGNMLPSRPDGLWTAVCIWGATLLLLQRAFIMLAVLRFIKKLFLSFNHRWERGRHCIWERPYSLICLRCHWQHSSSKQEQLIPPLAICTMLKKNMHEELQTESFATTFLYILEEKQSIVFLFHS